MAAIDRQTQELQVFLSNFDGLEHLHCRRRDSLITLFSGPKEDPLFHARFRNIKGKLWQLEMPTHTNRWQKTPFQGSLDQLMDALTSSFAWMLAPRS